MKVYLSWSGERSRVIADSLGRWLSQVIQAVEPWSPTETAGNDRWSHGMAEALESSRVGILCLTRDSLNEPWLMFEAGALSNTKGRILFTFLYDISPAEVRQPLGQFAYTTRDRADVWKLLTAINGAVLASNERGLEGPLLEQVFRIYWPILEQELANVPAMAPPPAGPERSERELLEEALLMLRGQEQRLASLERRAAAAAAARAQQLQRAAAKLKAAQAAALATGGK